MDGIYSEFIHADKLIESFCKENNKFESRFVSLMTDMNAFIKQGNLVDKVTVNPLLLGYTLVNYFEDIMRLKEFHHVGHVNNIKIVSYTAYWLLRMKPLQINGNDKILSYINERFILSYILSFLGDGDSSKLLSRDNAGLKSFTETLFYYLKYRSVNPQTLEIMLLAFFAGQVYQEKDCDISSMLGKFGNFSEES